MVGDVELEAFDVGHSIPGAFAALIESQDAQILYTGDFGFTAVRGSISEMNSAASDRMFCCVREHELMRKKRITNSESRTK